MCADVSPPPIPPPPSELMRGFLVLFLASWSWRAVRGRRREREEKQEEEEEEEEQRGDEKEGETEEREEEKRRGERGERGGCIEGRGAGGGGSHADFNCSSINTKLPAVRALNRDQTAKKNRKGERRVILSTQDGTAFFDLAAIFFLHQS